MLTRRCKGLWALALTAAISAALSGCGRSQQQAGKAPKRVIEVSFFEGGFGLAFFKEVARKYEKTHPGVKVNLWGDPRNGEKLRPRFIAGNPPDLVWAQDIPIWTLVAGNQVYPLDKELNGPSWDEPSKKWRDTLYPGTLDSFMNNGHIYGMPISMNLWMIWYDKAMFRKYGWQVPKTWAQFEKLCADIKATGIAPLAFQGRYPSYASRTIMDLVQRIGGLDAVKRLSNLEPGAWTDPEILKAATLVQDLMKKGYFQQGCMGMSHTESQMEFIQGRAAMVACGTWLKSEMGDAIPRDFEMSSFPVPMVEGGIGSATAVQTTNDRVFVPQEAKDPAAGADFLRFLTSEAMAREFIRQKEALGPTIVKNAPLPDALKDSVHCLTKAPFTWSFDVESWYPSFGAAHNDALSQLLTLKITPKEYCQLMEKAAAVVRNDPRVIRHRM